MLKFLIALDESDAALAAARFTAALTQRGAGVEVVLLNAQPSIRVGEVGAIAPTEITHAARIRAAAAILGPACLVLRRAGVRYSEHEAMGDPATVIAREANVLECDGILMGSRRLNPLKRLLLGSVSREVLRTVDRPVTLVASSKGRALGEPMRILAAVDGSPTAARAVQYAARLVREIPRSELHLVHVQPPLTVGGVLTVPREQLVEHWAAKGAESAFAEPIAMLDREQGAYTLHVEEGEPAVTIDHLARQLECDLIVMGTRGLGRVASLVLGSVADAVMRRSVVPVTMVQ